MEKPTRLKFKSRIIDGKLYTLDGKIEVQEKYYLKSADINLLSEEEKIQLMRDNETVHDVYNTILHRTNYL